MAKYKINQYGFTIVEILCVVAIIGIILCITLPYLKLNNNKNNTNSEVKAIYELFKEVRYNAITKAIPYQILYNDGDILVLSQNTPYKRIKINHSIEIITLYDDGFLFLPDGRVTPGKITFDKISIMINPCGRITIEHTSN